MTDFKLFRRKFFMHSAHKTIGVSSGPAALKVRNLDEFAVDNEPPEVLRVCLVSGAPTYNSDRSLAILERHLARHTDVECARAFSKAPDDLPGLKGLEGSDCMVLFTRQMAVDGEQLDSIRRYCRRGGAVVGVRSASHGLKNWPDMDRELFGGDYRGHYGNDSTEVAVADTAGDHPVLAGVEPFVSRGSLYRNPRIVRDADVLLTGTFGGSIHPVAWTLETQTREIQTREIQTREIQTRENGGRVFYTSLGHPHDFHRPAFLRLLANALHWACGKRC